MADPNLRQASETTEACPRCDMIFTLLETAESGERVQHVEMVERGQRRLLFCGQGLYVLFYLHSILRSTRAMLCWRGITFGKNTSWLTVL